MELLQFQFCLAEESVWVGAKNSHGRGSERTEKSGGGSIAFKRNSFVEFKALNSQVN